MVQFDPEDYTVVEGEDARLRIILTEASTMEVTVVLNTQDGTASGKENALVLLQRIRILPNLLPFRPIFFVVSLYDTRSTEKCTTPHIGSRIKNWRA